MAAAAPAEGTAALAVQDDSVDPHGVPLDMMPSLRQFLHGPNMPRTTAEERAPGSHYQQYRIPKFGRDMRLLFNRDASVPINNTLLDYRNNYSERQLTFNWRLPESIAHGHPQEDQPFINNSSVHISGVPDTLEDDALFELILT